MVTVIYLVPEAEVFEKAFCRQGCAGTGIADGHDLALQIKGGLDAGILANDQLGWCTIQEGNGAHFIIMGGIARQLAVTPEEGVAGIDDADINAVFVQGA